MHIVSSCTRVAVTSAEGVSRRQCLHPTSSCGPQLRLCLRQTVRPFTARRPLRRCAAADRDEQQGSGSSQGGSSTDSGTQAPPPDPAQAASRAAARVAEEVEVAKGQRTAVITGAVSIVFGVLYLVLVQFMDSRGGELQPPPPEAFGL